MPPDALVVDKGGKDLFHQYRPGDDQDSLHRSNRAVYDIVILRNIAVFCHKKSDANIDRMDNKNNG